MTEKQALWHILKTANKYFAPVFSYVAAFCFPEDY